MDGKSVAAGVGEGRWIGGERIVIKVGGSDTGQALAVVEDTVQPGYAPPPHIHVEENEIFYVLEGSFTFMLAGEAISAPPGTVVTVPKGAVHTFQNVGDVPGKLLAVVWPAVAFENFVAEAGTPEQPPGPPDIAFLLAAAERNGIVVPPPSG